MWLKDLTVIEVVPGSTAIMPAPDALALVINNPGVYQLVAPFGSGAYLAEGLLEAYRLAFNDPAATYVDFIEAIGAGPVLASAAQMIAGTEVYAYANPSRVASGISGYAVPSPWTGSGARTLPSQRKDRPHIRDWHGSGGVPCYEDGITDDGPLINTAIAALKSEWSAANTPLVAIFLESGGPSLNLGRVHCVETTIVAEDFPGFQLVGGQGKHACNLVSKTDGTIKPHVDYVRMGSSTAATARPIGNACVGITMHHRKPTGSGTSHVGRGLWMRGAQWPLVRDIIAWDLDKSFDIGGNIQHHIDDCACRYSGRITPGTYGYRFGREDTLNAAIRVQAGGNCYAAEGVGIPAGLDYCVLSGFLVESADGGYFTDPHFNGAGYAMDIYPHAATDFIAGLRIDGGYLDTSFYAPLRLRGGAGVSAATIMAFNALRCRNGQYGIDMSEMTGPFTKVMIKGGDISDNHILGVRPPTDPAYMVGLWLETQFYNNNRDNDVNGGDIRVGGTDWSIINTEHNGGSASAGSMIYVEPTAIRPWIEGADRFQSLFPAGIVNGGCKTLTSKDNPSPADPYIEEIKIGELSLVTGATVIYSFNMPATCALAMKVETWLYSSGGGVAAYFVTRANFIRTSGDTSMVTPLETVNDSEAVAHAWGDVMIRAVNTRDQAIAIDGVDLNKINVTVNTPTTDGSNRVKSKITLTKHDL